MNIWLIDISGIVTIYWSSLRTNLNVKNYGFQVFKLMCT